MISLPAMLLRMGLAIILGGLVGFERERRESGEHTAGMRTNALVALGSCLFTLVSAYGFLSFLGLPHVQLDPTRIASYIVAGIGFLGAGSIFLSKESNKVKGLTTAAAIWLVAGIGVTCGAGLLDVAVSATFLGLLVLFGLRFVERFLVHHRPASTLRIRIEATTIGGQLIDQVHAVLARSGFGIEELDLHSEQGVETLQVACHTLDAKTLAQVVGELRALPGVRAVHASIRNINMANVAAKGAKLEDS